MILYFKVISLHRKWKNMTPVIEKKNRHLTICNMLGTLPYKDILKIAYVIDIVYLCTTQFNLPGFLTNASRTITGTWCIQ